MMNHHNVRRSNVKKRPRSSSICALEDSFVRSCIHNLRVTGINGEGIDRLPAEPRSPLTRTRIGNCQRNKVETDNKGDNKSFHLERLYTHKPKNHDLISTQSE